MADEVSAALTVEIRVEQLFAVLADPTAHPAIDGTGWVQEPVDRAPLTEVGQLFRMDMYHPDASNGDYQVANQVHVFDAPRSIGWRTGYDPEGDGNLEFGGWFWRYDLEPEGPNTTRITLTYDWSAVPNTIREYLEFPPFPANHLTNSLRHLATLAARAVVPTCQSRDQDQEGRRTHLPGNP